MGGFSDGKRPIPSGSGSYAGMGGMRGGRRRSTMGGILAAMVTVFFELWYCNPEVKI